MCGCVCHQALGNDIELQSTTVFSIFARFLYVFGASLVVGLTFGLGTAVLLKVLKSNSAPQVSMHNSSGNEMYIGNIRASNKGTGENNSS